ncbi:hypothetical protein KJ853_03455, partial [Patescibacteria group bacterium]|nr:hypothetical protein [Patescibacteria group bacterium]
MELRFFWNYLSPRPYLNDTIKLIFGKQKRSKLLPAHGWDWGKGNIPFGGAFRKAKYEKLRRRKSEGGQKFLPRRVAKRLLRGLPPNPLLPAAARASELVSRRALWRGAFNL